MPLAKWIGGDDRSMWYCVLVCNFYARNAQLICATVACWLKILKVLYDRVMRQGEMI